MKSSLKDFKPSSRVIHFIPPWPPILGPPLLSPSTQLTLAPSNFSLPILANFADKIFTEKENNLFFIVKYSPHFHQASTPKIHSSFQTSFSPRYWGLSHKVNQLPLMPTCCQNSCASTQIHVFCKSCWSSGMVIELQSPWFVTSSCTWCVYVHFLRVSEWFAFARTRTMFHNARSWECMTWECEFLGSICCKTRRCVLPLFLFFFGSCFENWLNLNSTLFKENIVLRFGPVLPEFRLSRGPWPPPICPPP